MSDKDEKVIDAEVEGSQTDETPEAWVEEDKWVVLCETSGKECESWYYFIKYAGNEKALNYLQKQLEKIDMYILDDWSTFDLDLDHFFTKKTTEEMLKLEVNSYAFHRRFDGKLDLINLDLRRKDDNEDKLEKVNDKLGYGQIEDYIKDEYIDPADLSSSSDDEDKEKGEDDLLVPLPEDVPDEVKKKGPVKTEQIGGGMRRKKKKRRK
jgi:hypothetical protein